MCTVTHVVAELTCPWEEGVPVVVKGDGHDSVSQVEGLLYAISMVDVNVDVQDTWMILEQLEDGDDDVVDVAESTGFEPGTHREPQRCLLFKRDVEDHAHLNRSYFLA